MPALLSIQRSESHLIPARHPRSTKHPPKSPLQRLSLVIQELSLPSPSHILFRFGSHVLPGNPLELLRDRWSIHTESVIPATGWSLTPHNPRSEDKCLETWVAYGSDKICQNPLDRLYAVLGCCPSEIIRPDYTRTPGDVYRDFAKYLLEDHNIYHGEFGERRERPLEQVRGAVELGP